MKAFLFSGLMEVKRKQVGRVHRDHRLVKDVLCKVKKCTHAVA